MKLVIDIDEDAYKEIKKIVADGNEMCFMQKLIAKGTPLPKGHGRLVDELDLDLFAPSLGTDEYVRDLMAKHNIGFENGDDEDKVRYFAMDLIKGCMNVIKTAPTIIGADTESEG